MISRRALLLLLSVVTVVSAWLPSSGMSFTTIRQSSSLLHAKDVAGSFFNQVPEPNDDNDNKEDSTNNNNTDNNMESQLEDVLKIHRQPSRASEPSTINGVPTKKASAGTGFGSNSKIKATKIVTKQETTYVGIGPTSLNDVTNPEYDDQGYTLYADEKTGEKSRVFEALVDYPCLFTMKIVGANDGAFVQDMISIVATTCEVDVIDDINHSVKVNGKWTSVTVKAPVKNAEMLYTLYENVDRDPRVKFKF